MLPDCSVALVGITIESPVSFVASATEISTVVVSLTFAVKPATPRATAMHGNSVQNSNVVKNRYVNSVCLTVLFVKFVKYSNNSFKFLLVLEFDADFAAALV